MTTSTTPPIRLFVHGSTGRMGAHVLEVAAEHPAQVQVAGACGRRCHTELRHALNRADVIIDFSSDEGAAAISEAARDAGMALLCATTGLSERTRACVLAVGERAPVMIAPNTSLGVAVMRRLVREATTLLAGAEVSVYEAHHQHKRDRPSGTALSLVAAIAESGGPAVPREEVRVVREGEIVGTHEVAWAGPFDTLTVRHEAQNRRLFAAGAITLARWLVSRQPGVWSVDDWLSDRMVHPHGAHA